jgi:hypothetical protein
MFHWRTAARATCRLELAETLQAHGARDFAILVQKYVSGLELVCVGLRSGEVWKIKDTWHYMLI